MPPGSRGGTGMRLRTSWHRRAVLSGIFAKQYRYIMIQDLIQKAYTAFNDRNIDAALSTMHADVQWPKAFEGGHVQGHDEIRKYWTRQWTEIDPTVIPTEINERPDGTFEVTVHQTVKDLAGSLLFDGTVKHIYTLKDNLLGRMDIE